VERLPLVTIVCPVFNEAETVLLFYERLTKALAECEGKVRFELLFVNNRSTDRTLEVVRALAEKDPRVNYLTLSRNYGYQASITAGMTHAKGDAIGNIDVDCEDPPYMIPKFIDRWLAGVDVVYGVREKREEFVLMHLARKMYYRLTRRIGDHEIVLDMAEFFLVDKRVRDQIVRTASSFPFVRGQVGYVGFRREGIPYKRERRIAGETHYNLFSAMRFGFAGILTTSTLPLRIIAYGGAAILVALVGLGIAVPFLHEDLEINVTQSIALSIGCFVAAWFVYALGGIAVYLARVYKDGMSLPLYIVDNKLSEQRDPP
jgi:dolichol-phosphate mannosyltransferase